MESIIETVSSSELRNEWTKTYRTAVKGPGKLYRIEARTNFGSYVQVSYRVSEWVYQVESNRYVQRSLPQNWPEFPKIMVSKSTDAVETYLRDMESKKSHPMTQAGTAPGERMSRELSDAIVFFPRSGGVPPGHERRGVEVSRTVARAWIVAVEQIGGVVWVHHGSDHRHRGPPGACWLRTPRAASYRSAQRDCTTAAPEGGAAARWPNLSVSAKRDGDDSQPLHRR